MLRNYRITGATDVKYLILSPEVPIETALKALKIDKDKTEVKLLKSILKK